MSVPVIAYAGMTHLGLCSAVGAATKGFEVVCFDPDEGRVSALARGELPVVEPDLPELRRASEARLHFTTKPADLARCDVVTVAPDVRTDDQGRSDLSEIEALLALVIRHLRPGAVLVVLSQVPPGFTRSHVQEGLVLYYQVETLIFGRAMERATEPERFIVGCADEREPLPEAYAAFLSRFGCPILPMRYESAELAKIAINACLVSSVSVANSLAEICEGVGARWSEIAPALKLDRRIGPHAYLAPGLGIAGGNLERDLGTLRRLAGELGTDDGVIRAWTANSRHRRDWALRALHREVIGRVSAPCIAVLGLAYKQDTASTKNSPSLALLADLEPFAVQVYDPVVPSSAVAHPRVRGAGSALEACRGADAVCLMTPWAEFRRLDPAALSEALRGRVVIDPHGLLEARACMAAGLDHLVLGEPPARAAGREG